MPAAVMPDYFEKLQARIWQEFSEGIATWGQSVTELSRWEQEHLVDAPSPEVLASHRRAVERLVRFGQFIVAAAQHPEFPVPALREDVAATLQTLRDKIPLWHGTMPMDQAEALLKAAFPE